MNAAILSLFNRAEHAIRRRERSSAVNLAGLKAGLLVLLDKPEGAGFGEVARALETTAPRLSELAHRMADAGLLMRLAVPGDGRAQRLMLTSSGEKARRDVIEASVDLDKLMTESLTSDEIAVIKRWLENVRVRCEATKGLPYDAIG